MSCMSLYRNLLNQEQGTTEYRICVIKNLTVTFPII